MGMGVSRVLKVILFYTFLVQDCWFLIEKFLTFVSFADLSKFTQKYKKKLLIAKTW